MIMMMMMILIIVGMFSHSERPVTTHILNGFERHSFGVVR